MNCKFDIGSALGCALILNGARLFIPKFKKGLEKILNMILLKIILSIIRLLCFQTLDVAIEPHLAESLSASNAILIRSYNSCLDHTLTSLPM